MKNKKIYVGIGIIVLFLLLWSNYTANLWGGVDEEWFRSWQADSEELVLTRIDNIKEYGIFYKAGLLGDYTSQIGLGGTFYGILSLLFHIDDNVVFLYGINVFFLCLVLFYILKWVYEEFGTLTAILTYVFLFYNEWIIVSARNLYWVTFTFFLPFICSLYFLKKEERTGDCSLKQWSIIAFVLIFIRASCGFEMISLVMINLEAPLFYYAFKNRMEKGRFFKRFLSIGTVAILAFVVCMLIHTIQLGFYFEGDFKNAVAVKLNNVGYRTGAFVNSNSYSGIMRTSLEASKLDVLETYFNDGRPLLFNLHMNSISYICGISLLMCGASEHFWPNIAKLRRKLIALVILIMVCFLGPLSWYILASAHSYIHVTINYMLWSMPTVILITVLFSKIIIEVIKEAWKRHQRSCYIAIGTILIIIGYFYIDITKLGTQYLNYFQTDGYLMLENQYVEAYIMEKDLYLVMDKEYSDIFLNCEIYTEDSLKMQEPVLKSFKLGDSEIKTPFWTKKKIAVLPEISNQGDFIKINQKIEETIVWEGLIDIKVPDKIKVANLTDEYRTNGYHNWQSYFLAEPLANNEFIVGRKLILPDGKTAEVIDCVLITPYQYIFVDIDLSPYKTVRAYPVV